MGNSLLRAAATAAALLTLPPPTYAAPASPSTYAAASSASSLPIVDLGYELQQATLYNSTGQFYNFSNIRYAAPPTGNLRFRAPQPPARNRSTVQKGSPDRI